LKSTIVYYPYPNRWNRIPEFLVIYKFATQSFWLFSMRYPRQRGDGDINTAIYQKAEGIGFAIPIENAKRIINDLISNGRDTILAHPRKIKAKRGLGPVCRAWLPGTDVQPITSNPNRSKRTGYNNACRFTENKRNCIESA